MCIDCDDELISTNRGPKGDTGASGANGTNGTNGTNGNDGQDGANGQYGGYSTVYSFSDTTTSSPASQTLRFNNTTFSLVTTIYISETNQNLVNVSSFLSTFAISGYIKIFKEFDSSKFWMGKITALVDSGLYRTITVTYILHNSPINNNEDVIITYQPPGTIGVTGASGTNGNKGRGIAVFVRNDGDPLPVDADVAADYPTWEVIDQVLKPGDFCITIL